jgi:hypothetical protein
VNEDTDEDKAERRHHILSKFFCALDPRSRNPSLDSNSQNFNCQPEATHPTTMPTFPVQLRAVPVDPRSNQAVLPIRPSSLPLTTVQMELWADKTEVGRRKTRTWVNIEITADIDMESGRLPADVQPLDVVIILDIMLDSLSDLICAIRCLMVYRERSTIVGLTHVTNAAYVLASALDAHDRLAIVCVDNSEEGGLRVLLPLKSHPLVGVQKLLDGLPDLALEGGIWNRSGLNKAIRGASDMLVEESYSLPHIFLISADRRESLAVPRIHPSVGFHTISFDRQFQRAEEGPYGWHIFPDMAARVPECRDAVLMNKIVRVVTHLHTGLETGVVSNLVLHVMAGRGCCIESVIGDTYRARLRPGEKWALSVLVRVKEPEEKDEEQTPLDGAIEQLMTELQEMLECDFEINHCIIGAGLTYHHSLLTPGDGFVSMAGCCQGIQPPEGNFGSDLA